MKPMVFSISNRILIMEGVAYSAVSGPFKNGPLPIGEYKLSKLVKLNPHTSNKGFVVKKTAFWIKLYPQFETTRTGLGIHPDGNIPGTLGCIGISGDFSVLGFIEHYEDLQEKPTRLIVVE